MQHLLEILKIIEAATSKDARKAIAYANQLATKLEEAGESKTSERIRRAVEKAQEKGVTPSSLMFSQRLPVDSESRLDLADESSPKLNETTVFFPESVHALVDEFLRDILASDTLIAEGVSISATMLLYGPPGCGKTELARFIAARLQLPLLTARADTLVSSYLGSTSKNLRLLFDHASSRPCVLFLDEFDSVAKHRDDRHEMGELKQVVVSLLQNIDAVKNNTVLLAATNHEHLLDQAIWRRFIYRIKIDYPDENARFSMYKSFLNKKITDKSYLKMSKASNSLSVSDIREICDAALRYKILENKEYKHLEKDILKRIIIRKLNIEDADAKSLILLAKNNNDSKVFTHELLAEMFSMTKGNVSHILKKAGSSMDSEEV